MNDTDPETTTSEVRAGSAGLPPSGLPRLQTPAVPGPVGANRSWQNRAVAASVLVPALGVLVLASILKPSPKGMGTHEQLGLPPCGFKLATGLPCATCGMTTSFAHAAQGNLLAAVLTQPAGTVLAVLTAMATIICGWAVLSGMSLAPIGRAVGRPAVVLVLGVLVLGGWAYTLSIQLGGVD